NISKPRFPAVFQVDVQGIFKDEKKEMVGTLYYDSLNNRGAFHFTYQGVTSQYIYRFDDNELLHISGYVPQHRTLKLQDTRQDRVHHHETSAQTRMTERHHGKKMAPVAPPTIERRRS
ncbi:hypothetical protein AVEN_115896-1, partial [Araneus ventricosus]